MVSPTKIIVKMEKAFIDELDFNGGKIYLDPTYRPEWNAFPYAEVVSSPLRNPNMVGDFYYTVQDGDKLYINYGVVNDPDNLIQHDGQEYWLVDYFMAMATVRDGKVIPVGEHILIEPIEEEVSSSMIVIPEMSRKKIVNRGKVFASNDPEIPEGSTVMFEEVGMFENEIEGKKLFVMFNSNILGILN
jgi:co-chaperonin GroES (HSP10)